MRMLDDTTRRPRLSLPITVALLVALAASTLASATVEAASQEGRFAFINGFPGKTIDICVNGRELKSNLPYGGYWFRRLRAGTKKVAFFRADPRECRGQRLTQKRIELPTDGDLSVVLTKASPRIVVFENPGVPSASWRSAADFRFEWLRKSIGPNWRARPYVLIPHDGPWRKGDEFRENSRLRSYKVRKPGGKAFLTGRTTGWVVSGHPGQVETYILGTRPKNARGLTFSRTP